MELHNLEGSELCLHIRCVCDAWYMDIFCVCVLGIKRSDVDGLGFSEERVTTTPIQQVPTIYYGNARIWTKSDQQVNSGWLVHIRYI